MLHSVRFEYFGVDIKSGAGRWTARELALVKFPVDIRTEEERLQTQLNLKNLFLTFTSTWQKIKEQYDN